MTDPLARKPKPPDSSPASTSAGEDAPAARDVMLIHGVSEDGQNLAVLRARNGQVEAGVVRQAKAGQPITGELVRLTPRAEAPLVCDVAVEYAAPSEAKLSHGGPAQVATRSYRQNWDAIWSDTRKKSAPN